MTSTLRGPGPLAARPGGDPGVSPVGEPMLVLRGPVAAAITAGPASKLFVADRAGAVLFRLDPSGRRADLAKFTDADAPRGVAFFPARQGWAARWRAISPRRVP